MDHPKLFPNDQKLSKPLPIHMYETLNLFKIQKFIMLEYLQLLHIKVFQVSIIMIWGGLFFLLIMCVLPIYIIMFIKFMLYK